MMAQAEPGRAIAPGDVIGFVGLGQMGTEMSIRLVQAGYTVQGYDVRADRCAILEAAGGQAVGAAADVAAGATAVILMLPNSDIVAEVLLQHGLLAAIPAGSLVIDMSSSQPDATQELAARAAESGAALVDAPVSGGVRGAKAGTLTIMFGGTGEQFARCQGPLAAMGKSLVHAGGAGAGHALKALNNLLSAAHFAATSEAISIGRRFGLDPRVMLDAINGSSGKNWSSEFKFPTYVLPESYTSGFALRLLVKDTQIAVDLARHVGQPAPHAEATLRLWREAAEALPADADHTEIARWVASLPGAD
jgi:3-hydroxyisobutyrate dehydrogenase